MFTIEFQTRRASSYDWTRSTARYDTFSIAADVLAGWLICNDEHGIELTGRVVTAEITGTHTISEAA